jgi:hypothetical protein
MSTTLSHYEASLHLLFNDIGYLYGPLPPGDPDFWEPLHEWMTLTLGPSSSWNAAQLTELEHAAGGVIERSYPHSSLEVKLLFAKLTAIAILLDDSIDDPAVNEDIAQFSHKLVMGDPQPNPMLALYHDNIKQLSNVYGKDTVLRDLAVIPWISYIDACLMEKDIYVTQVSIITSDRWPLYLLPPQGHPRTEISVSGFRRLFSIRRLKPFGWACP